jgi:hypothetical protein
MAPQIARSGLPTQWHITEARSTTLKVRAPIADEAQGPPGTILTAGEVPVQTSTFIQLTGRSLSMVVGLRWFPRAGAVPPMAIEHLHSALLAGLMTVSSTCRGVAAALDAAEPAELAPWEAWLQPHQELRTSDVLNVDAFPKDGSERPPQGGYFARSRTDGNAVEQLDKLARDWVTVLLLDMGIKEFENALSDLPLPSWAIHES